MYIAINCLIFPLNSILKIQDGLLEWGDMKLLITDMAFHSIPFQYCNQYDLFALTNVIITHVKLAKLQLYAGTRNF